MRPILITICLLTLAVLIAPAPTGARQAQPVHIGPGGQLIIGGFDPTSRADGARNAEELDRAAPRLKGLGITSHEVYVRWNLCGVASGRWDWSVYDRYV